jgi:hypothetical protein
MTDGNSVLTGIPSVLIGIPDVSTARSLKPTNQESSKDCCCFSTCSTHNSKHSHS